VRVPVILGEQQVDALPVGLGDDLGDAEAESAQPRANDGADHLVELRVVELGPETAERLLQLACEARALRSSDLEVELGFPSELGHLRGEYATSTEDVGAVAFGRRDVELEPRPSTVDHMTQRNAARRAKKTRRRLITGQLRKLRSKAARKGTLPESAAL
jgi:hypothetical protein